VNKSFKRTIGTETQKKITELLKTHQFDSVDSVQQFFLNMGCRSGEKEQKQFTVDLKVAENSVAESEN
jgi:exonuclease SbcC